MDEQRSQAESMVATLQSQVEQGNDETAHLQQQIARQEQLGRDLMQALPSA